MPRQGTRRFLMTARKQEYDKPPEMRTPRGKVLQLFFFLFFPPPHPQYPIPSTNPSPIPITPSPLPHPHYPIPSSANTLRVFRRNRFRERKIFMFTWNTPTWMEEERVRLYASREDEGDARRRGAGRRTSSAMREPRSFCTALGESCCTNTRPQKSNT